MATIIILLQSSYFVPLVFVAKNIKRMCILRVEN